LGALIPDFSRLREMGRRAAVAARPDAGAAIAELCATLADSGPFSSAPKRPDACAWVRAARGRMRKA